MVKTILIADSGTTKTDWRFVRDGVVVKAVSTKGMNPYFQSDEEIRTELEIALIPHLDDQSVATIFFYGAGCVFDKADRLRKVLTTSLGASEIQVYSDLLAAAHSTCGRTAGIACILGTGSNSCFYDGQTIARQIPSLGFLLGDEGGGAMLGRLLVADVLKEMLPSELRNAFFERFRLTQAEILDRVYKQPFPNRFLASLSPFLREHLEQPAIYQLVFNSFVSFFTRNVMHYDYQQYPVHFVGSVAYHYQDVLQAAADHTAIHIGKIIKHPIEELVRFAQLNI